MLTGAQGGKGTIEPKRRKCQEIRMMDAKLRMAETEDGRGKIWDDGTERE
jgi:hypothetical protein